MKAALGAARGADSFERPRFLFSNGRPLVCDLVFTYIFYAISAFVLRRHSGEEAPCLGCKNIGNDKGKRWGEQGWRIELWNIAKWLAENSAYAGRLFISNAGIAAPAAR